MKTKIDKGRFSQLEGNLQDLLDINHEMSKKEIRHLFLSRRRHAKNYPLLEIYWTDLWREAFKFEMETLLSMAKRVEIKARKQGKDDSLESLSYLLESEFSLLPNAPRLQEYSLIAMKIVTRGKVLEVKSVSMAFEKWIQKRNNKVRVLSDSGALCREQAGLSKAEIIWFRELCDRYVRSVSFEEKEKIYLSTCLEYFERYSEKYPGINFSDIAKNKSRISFQARQIKKSFSVGYYLPQAMLELIISKKKNEKKGSKKVANIADYRKTA